MIKIIAGVLLERDADPYAFDVRVHDLGHGHTEATCLPRYGWTEPNCSKLARDNALMGEHHDFVKGDWVPAQPVVLSADDQAELDALNRERSTRRARTKVRRLAKAKGLTTLLTLTYRENMVDRDRIARDFDVFCKRLRRVVPGLEYVCVFERQKRGAWHAHIAVQRVLPHYAYRGRLVRSYDLLRSMWRAVVGADNGNIDVSRNRRVQRSSAKLAAYLSKYIGKTFDQAEKHVNAYSASGRALPAPVIRRVLSPQLVDAITALFDLVAVEAQTSEMHQALLDGGGYYLCLAPPPT